MPYIVKIPQFEGPLDQLLTLAQQGQVDLREIPLAHIAEAYLAGTEHKVDLEEATEVLWMLAAMIEMKSRLLVPKPQTPAEPLAGRPPQGVPVRGLCAAAATKLQVIGSSLALLALIKNRRVRAHQPQMFAPIRIALAST